LEAERRLREVIPEQTARTFCYPCYQEHVGEGPTRQSYVPVIARHFPAARGKGERANPPRTCDVHYLWSWPVERATGAELVRRAGSGGAGRSVAPGKAPGPSSPPTASTPATCRSRRSTSASCASTSRHTATASGPRPSSRSPSASPPGGRSTAPPPPTRPGPA